MNSISRRNFLQSATTGALVMSQAPALLGAADSPKLRLGLIGCGGYGMANARAALQAGGVEIAAVCDVDSEHLEKSAGDIEKTQGKRPKTFKLHDDLLALPELEAAVISTPPQWHALQLIGCLKRGLDVYCEKPLAYDIREGRVMVDAVKKSGRVVQVGFQRRQSAAFRAVQERVQSGTSGKVICAEATINYTAGTKDPTPQAPPASLDWDMWCGPAPKIPYSPQVGHVNWRLEQTTGHGHLVDWGVHLIDAARMILGEGMPKAVAASGGLYQLRGRITTPDVLTAHFEFPGCPLTWRHRVWGAEEYNPAVANGIFLYTEKETIFVTDDRWEIIPRGRNQDKQAHEAKVSAGLLHMKAFLDSVRTRKPPGCSIEEGYASTTTVKLAMISYDTGSRIEWDAAGEQIVNHPKAAALLKRDYRKPWQHPFAG